MQEKLSALLDGELDETQTASLLAALGQDAKLRQEWQVYHLIGDVLRDTGSTATSITGRVAERLASEPTYGGASSIVIPESGRVTRPAANRGWYSLAASVAGIAFVGWAAWQSLVPTEAEPNAAVLAGTSTTVEAKSSTQQTVSYPANASDYWVAHRQLSGHMLDSNDGRIEFVSIDQSNEGAE